MKRVWLNINTGQFSNSWLPGVFGDSYISEPKIQQEATERGWKLIEYQCINDPAFELYDRMRIRDKEVKLK